MNLIQMYVTGIALDVRNNHPLVILNDDTKERALPIWIGQPEAQAIARALEGFKSERPLTHDLMLELVKASGKTIKHIEINDLNDNTYYSTIILEDKKGNLLPMDSRPSDAITLSIKVDCPIYITQRVFDEGTIPAELSTISEEGDEEEEDDEEESDEDFKNFVRNVKASDFKLGDSDH